MSVAFVLGNGISRKVIPLEPLKEKGKIYGCNAIYRDYPGLCNHIVAVDSKMVFELVENNIPNKTPVWTNPNRSYKKFQHLNFFEPSLGWSSGPTALHLASIHRHKLIYILGFDFMGTPEGKHNNLYSDSKNYKKSSDVATYHGNWNRQCCIILQKNPSKTYIRVIADRADPTFKAVDLKKFTNYHELKVSEFKQRYNL
tara:strand:- start:3126 stop:3722 length:597 start_codon:yes stop_codon:yes gene_type:complete